MAYRTVRTRKDADKLANALMEINGGYQPSIFHTDTKNYRVQDNEIGNAKFDEIMERLGIERA